MYERSAFVVVSTSSDRGRPGSRPDFPDLTSFYLMFIPGFEGRVNDVACLHVQLPKPKGILHANSSYNDILSLTNIQI